MQTKIFRLIAALVVFALVLAPAGASTLAAQPVVASQVEQTADTEGEASALQPSHRLIVELQSPALAVAAKSDASMFSAGQLDLNSASAQLYIDQLKTEQAAFASQMQALMPEASVANYINELGASVDLTYQVVFNGIAVDPGELETDEAARILAGMKEVKHVYADYPHQPDLAASLPLINAQAVWSLAGGRADAGSGILVASIDGGIHKDALMFDGTGWTYPAGFPPQGLGLTENNNGKIVASRAYFRPWDPPAPGDENPWPGVNGTEHGVHTSGIAAGNVVDADYTGITMTLSGVAPGAWLMSYRVFYASVNGIGSFYDAEGIKAIEDMTMDGADVVNNSWGGGPTSTGGEFDALDTALINAANAGVFVSMSAGNAGSQLGTTDHPSDEYIVVGNSTTNSLFVDGKISVVGGDATVTNMPFLTAAGWGGSFSVATPFTYTFSVAENIAPSNAQGCNAFPAGTFTGKAAVIARGSCEFGQKAYRAQLAGASAVVIYNNDGGTAPMSMGAGVFGSLVTIPTLSIGAVFGPAMNTWEDGHPSPQYTGEVKAFQLGSVQDFMAASSSRGPGVGMVLKPDITAPGTNIVSHGYGFGATGEARHLSFGQASGTSMASPHVAGSAAILRELHPTWSNAWIKSALMSTSKYMGVWNSASSHAQPLDMGAGRLDLTHASDPGVILDPPSLSFGQLMKGETATITVTVTSVANATETYTPSLGTVGGTYPTAVWTSGYPGFSITPVTQITLDPGETATFAVKLDSAVVSGTGDKQGFLVLDGSTHDAHMPFWGRVVPVATAPILLLDFDVSELYGVDYSPYYTDALDALGENYVYYNAAEDGIPSAAFLASFDKVVLFSGDHWQGFTFASSLPTRLMEYMNQGGKLILMGQDYLGIYETAVSSTFGMGATLIQDSISNNGSANDNIEAMVGGPSAWGGLQLNISRDTTVNLVDLEGSNEVPPVTTNAAGVAELAYNPTTNLLNWRITVQVTTTEPITITAAHIHTGTVGVNGPILYNLTPTGVPRRVNNSFAWSGTTAIDPAHETAIMSGGTYINVHSTAYPGGHMRGQVDPYIRDGAGNQRFVDEIMPWQEDNFHSILRYSGPYNIVDGAVGMSHRDQPTLERPGISYLGRSIFTSFGLEGVNDALSNVTRAELLEYFLMWTDDEPAVDINVTASYPSSNLMVLEADFSSTIDAFYNAAVGFRWDFGDGSAIFDSGNEAVTGHTYEFCGLYEVTVEATDAWGNKVLSSEWVNVNSCTTHRIFMPQVFKFFAP